MRRAALATFLCAGPLLAATAHASTDLTDRVVLREALRAGARMAGRNVVRLPLPEPVRASAAATGELAHVAASRGRTRVLVGVTRHEQLAGVAAELRALGARPHALTTIGVLSATVPSGASLAAALRDDPRVAYIERDRVLRVAQDPFDTIDPATGIKFTWAFDDVHAAEALFAAGGGSSRMVAVVDTGLDVSHPEFADRVARTFDTGTRRTDVTDTVGHGTFVAGLIAAVDGNGVGGKGVAGTTRIVAVNAEEPCEDGSRGCFTVGDLVRGIEFSMRSGARVINMSLAGESFTRSQARALESAFFNDVLPVAASGNNAERAQNPNPLEFPAAALGGIRGGRGIGLSVAATTPNGGHAGFSTHNDFVSLAAPGASGGTCEFGVFSTLPRNPLTDWDRSGSCSRILVDASGARFAYGEGTSFAAPIASGIAALVWQVERRLASEQVAEVLTRSARQTIGGGWNEFTGSGIVDGQAASALARAYDVTPPRARAKALRRPGNRVKIAVARSRDRTEAGRELAGRVTYGLLASPDGTTAGLQVLVSRRSRPFTALVRLRGRRPNLFLGTACDRNGNCDFKRLGRFRRR
ncbi:MAG TPA: S8 family serine peptidase [Thermoleophilaceae bacterium]|nr:S8 family serine peptidase [Thermoleophilaceae bacterium]